MTDTLSAATAPELVNDLTNQSLKASAPRLPDPPDCSVSLPGGYIDADGVLHQSAMVREMNGEDEEAIQKAANAKNVIEPIDILLSRAVESVGPHAVTKEMVGNLLVGDRDALLVGIRIATYGRELETFTRCERCDLDLTAHVDLIDDVKIKELEEPSQRVYDVELRNGGSARFRLMTGADQRVIFERPGTLAEMNSIMLSRVLLSINGEDFHAGFTDTLVKAKKLSKADRETIIARLVELQPGPQLGEVSAQCDSCGRDIPIGLSAAVLLW